MKLQAATFVFVSSLLFWPLMYVTPILLNLLRPPSPFAAKRLPSFLPTLFFTYALLSVPSAIVLWKIQPSRRVWSYCWAVLLSVPITIIERLIGTLNIATYFLYFGAGSLFIAPLMTYNVGPLLWALSIGEVRWQWCRISEKANSAKSR